MTPAKKRRRVALIRPRNLLWVVTLAAIVGSYHLYGTPHLRVRYTWSGDSSYPVYSDCEYFELHSARIVPRDGNCPLIKFIGGRE